MEGKAYIVKGEIKGKENTSKFEAHVKANSEKFAKEKALANMGSRHKLNRHEVRIISVDEAK